MICGQGVAPAAATIAGFRALGLDLIPGTDLLATAAPAAFGAWMRLLQDWRMTRAPLPPLWCVEISAVRRLLIAMTVPLLTLVLLTVSAFAVEGIDGLLREVHWGEPADALMRQFAAATRLPRPFDFGDSYADVVLHGATLGGVPVAVFFQMDKTTRGLKRVQLEPLGHQINPAAFRAIAAALHREYGRPDSVCVTPPVPAAGYQAAVEEQWRPAHATITAIFRDTTLQAFEGCLYGPASGWCGLHGHILVRAIPPVRETSVCAPPSRPG